MTTKLTIEFTKRALGTPLGAEGYYLYTKVVSESTEPTDFYVSLVYSPSLGAVDDREHIGRVATLSELTSMPAYAPELTVFQAPSLAASGVLAGDVIRITSVPPIWKELNFKAPDTFTVDSVVSPTKVLVDDTSPFLSQELNLKYEIFRGSTRIYPTSTTISPEDGEADRNWPAMIFPEYRIAEHVDYFELEEDFDTAVVDIQTTAQSLVDEYNAYLLEDTEVDTFTGGLTSTLQITFERLIPVVDEAYMKTSVNIANPTTLLDCLVVRKMDSAGRERLVRVTTLDELDTISDSPPPLTLFTSPSLYNETLSLLPVLAGDTLRISPVPYIWTRNGYTSAAEFLVVDTPTEDTLEISPAFPSAEKDFTWEINRGVIPVHSGSTDGVADRDYTDEDLYFRINEHEDYIEGVDTALTLLSTLKAEAQSLVDANDTDTISGVDTEVYE